MTTFKEPARTGRLDLAAIVELFAAGDGLPVRFTAYDGSSAGPADTR
ncbi:MAG: SAM-dependent methyltransferase, partial [Actinobacteria bacterium]|nr:SAM-dependent methyltransferase [Actinomycetota bacterium]